MAGSSRLRYAIFGLGDTAYPHFCGFTQALDARLTQYGARAIINRVDADVNVERFFTTWLTTLDKVLAAMPRRAAICICALPPTVKTMRSTPPSSNGGRLAHARRKPGICG